MASLGAFKVVVAKHRQDQPALTRSPRGYHPSKFSCFLAVLFFSEFLLLSISFDSTPLAVALDGRDKGLWRHFVVAMATIRYVPRSAAVLAVIIIAFGGRWLVPLMRPWTLRRASERVRWLYLLSHLLAFVGHFYLTAQLWKYGAENRPYVEIEAPVRAVLGFLAVVSLGLAALPRDGWLVAARAIGRGWVLGFALTGLVREAGYGATLLWCSLGHSTFLSVGTLLRAVFTDTVFQPDDFIVGTSTFSVQIAPGCSGYEGIGLVLRISGRLLVLASSPVSLAACFSAPADRISINLVRQCGKDRWSGCGWHLFVARGGTERISFPSRLARFSRRDARSSRMRAANALVHRRHTFTYK